MKVFEFSFDVDYGGGIMLIAAKDKERACEIADGMSRGFHGFWIYDTTRDDITYNGNDEGDILSYTRTE